MNHWHDILRSANVFVKYRQGLTMTRQDIRNVVRAIPTRISRTQTTHPSVPYALTPENKERVMTYHDIRDVFTPSQGRAMLGKVQRRAAYVFQQTGLKRASRSPKRSPRKTSKSRSGNRKKK
jgi:hypothetical protein